MMPFDGLIEGLLCSESTQLELSIPVDSTSKLISESRFGIRKKALN